MCSADKPIYFGIEGRQCDWQESPRRFKITCSQSPHEFPLSQSVLVAARDGTARVVD